MIPRTHSISIAADESPQQCGHSSRGIASLRSPLQSRFSLRKRAAGYLLLELILAMTLFGLAVLGLARTLQLGIQTSGIIQREYEVRLALRCFLEEVRRKPLAELSQNYLEPRLGLTFQSTVEPIQLRNYQGTVLNDLYKLRVFTTYEIGAEVREESLEVFIYKPRTESSQQSQGQ